jgi:hypothetical protein
MTIGGIGDMLVMTVGLVYPTYKMLDNRNDEEELRFWQKYLMVFGFVFCTLEITDYVLSNVWPIVVCFVKIGGITTLALNYRLCGYTYEQHVIPLFLKHEPWLKKYATLTKDFFREKLGPLWNWLPTVEQFHPSSTN